MKNVFLALVAMIFATTVFGQDSTITYEQLVAKVAKLEKKMVKVEKKLDGKISAVRVDLTTYETDNNTAVSNLNTNLNNLSKKTDDSLHALKDSTNKKFAQSAKKQTNLENNISDSNGKIKLLLWLIIFIVLIVLILWIRKVTSPNDLEDKRTRWQRFCDLFKEN